jgi:hypothetical protein
LPPSTITKLDELLDDGVTLVPKVQQKTHEDEEGIEVDERKQEPTRQGKIFIPY